MRNKTIDGHVHLENGPLTCDYVLEFVKAAQRAGLKELQILDHTHRFFEFRPLYERVEAADFRQKAWVKKKQKNSIQEYWDLIEEVKKLDLPVKVTFGLEVCYDDQHESFLKNELAKYPYDFLVGAVHSIDGFLYDIDAFSVELLWDRHEAGWIYHRYYDQLEKAIASDLFTQIAHPDVIKMQNRDPGYDLIPEYERLAELAAAHHVKMEDSTGAHYRYHHREIGLNHHFRRILADHHVELIPASDAHYPDHVAMDLDLLP